jgi:SAM-dependent methyltransferase
MNARRILSWARRWLTTRLGPRPAPTSGTTRYPQRYRVLPPPTRIPTPWPEPPAVDQPAAPATPPAPPAPPRAYDLALFEELQAEYSTKRLVRAAPRYDRDSVTKRSQGRIETIHARIGLAGKTTLEVGCGSGFEVWYLGTHLGCDAWGIDPVPRRAWPSLTGPRVHLVDGDMAAAPALPSATFDRVLSFTVWEHIEHPYAALQETYRVMKPGGVAWIRANLYRGPTASHRYRHIHFPFPHLLFPDDVIAEGLGRAGGPAVGAAWVNRLTWEQYEAYIIEVGFRIKALSFDIYPLDEPFYARFEDVLGRYPRRDLERGFFSAILAKPPRWRPRSGSTPR